MSADSTQVHISRSDPGRWLRACWILLPVAPGVICLATISPWVCGDDGVMLIVPAPWISPVTGLAAGASWLGLALLTAATRGRRGPGWIAIVVTALTFVPGTFLALVRADFGWRPFSHWTRAETSALVVRDGAVWQAFGRRWLEGGLMLARRESDAWLFTAWREVVFGDLGTEGPLILPAGADHSSVLVESNGFIAAMWGPGRRALMVTSAGRPLAGAVRRPWDHVEDAGQPSPFALIGANDELDEASVVAIENRIAAPERSRAEEPDGVPLDDDLVWALDAPHPGIRGAAARFVRAAAGRPWMYPKARDRLDR